jgi:hypothetical protein
MNRVTSRKPRSYKGLHTASPKTARRELSVTERAFIAGACIAGSLSHGDAVHCFDGRISKSTITRAVQHVLKFVKDYGCKVTDPRCFETLPGRGAPAKLTKEQRELVVQITT